MTQQLHDELHRLGEDAPLVTLPPDTWARGRRLRRRDRWVTGGALVALVAVLGTGLALLRPSGDPAPQPTDGSGRVAGVPDHVWAVPERLTMTNGAGSWTGPVSGDVAVGRASVAFGTEGGPVVVVTAADGRYHLLDLPHRSVEFARWSAVMGEGVGLALSPDGRRLAYTIQPEEFPDSARPAGVAVVDLETGDSSVVASGDRLVVTGLVWSPDSAWLGFSGLRARSVSESGWRGGPPVVGRAGADGTSASISGTLPRFDVATIDAGGIVVMLGEGRVQTWTPGSVTRRPTSDRLPRNAAEVGMSSPDGSRVALGVTFPGQHLPVYDARRLAYRERELGPDLHPEGAVVRPLGWLDDSHVVAQVTPVSDFDGGGRTSQGGQVVVMTTPDVSAASATYRIVGRVESTYPDTLSVAVDLMSLDRPTVAFEQPDWGWSTERKVGITLAGLAGVVLLGLLGLRLRPRRSFRSP